VIFEGFQSREVRGGKKLPNFYRKECVAKDVEGWLNFLLSIWFIAIFEDDCHFFYIFLLTITILTTNINSLNKHWIQDFRNPSRFVQGLNMDWWAQILFSILWYWKVCKFSKHLENTSFTLENPYFLKNSQVFCRKILKVCWTKVIAIMNRVRIFNFVITRKLVTFSKNQKIIQIYMRKPKISTNVPTLIQKKCKNLLEKTDCNHEPVKRLGLSTKCKVIWQLCWWVISVGSLKSAMKPRLTYK